MLIEIGGVPEIENTETATEIIEIAIEILEIATEIGEIMTEIDVIEIVTVTAKGRGSASASGARENVVNTSGGKGKRKEIRKGRGRGKGKEKRRDKRKKKGEKKREVGVRVEAKVAGVRRKGKVAENLATVLKIGVDLKGNTEIVRKKEKSDEYEANIEITLKRGKVAENLATVRRNVRKKGGEIEKVPRSVRKSGKIQSQIGKVGAKASELEIALKNQKGKKQNLEIAQRRKKVGGSKEIVQRKEIKKEIALKSARCGKVAENLATVQKSPKRKTNTATVWRIEKRLKIAAIAQGNATVNREVERNKEIFLKSVKGGKVAGNLATVQKSPKRDLS